MTSVARKLVLVPDLAYIAVINPVESLMLQVLLFVTGDAPPLLEIELIVILVSPEFASTGVWKVPVPPFTVSVAGPV